MREAMKPPGRTSPVTDEELMGCYQHAGPGKRGGGDPKDEAEHFMKCGACGQAFDMRDLSQVFYHEEPDHKPMPRS